MGVTFGSPLYKIKRQLVMKNRSKARPMLSIFHGAIWVVFTL